MTWRVQLSRQASRAYDRLPATDRRRLERALDRLGEEPRPAGKLVKAIQGTRDSFLRYRVGEYRILYDVIDADGNQNHWFTPLTNAFAGRTTPPITAAMSQNQCASTPVSGRLVISSGVDGSIAGPGVRTVFWSVPVHGRVAVDRDAGRAPNLDFRDQRI